MYCSRCGTQLPDQAVRCGACDAAPLPPPPVGSQPVRFTYDGASSRWPTVFKLAGVLAALAVIFVAVSPWVLPVEGELDAAGSVAIDTTTTAVATTVAPITSETSAAVPIDLANPGPSIAGLVVTATCTARGSTDSAGNPIDFKPENTLDAVPATAWRCAGDGAGVSLTYALPAPSDVTVVGMIPGFDAIDASNGDDRFTQNRRVSSANWVCVGQGDVVVASQTQSLEDSRAVQNVLTSGFVGCSAIRVEITGASAPGTRDFVAISEVTIVGPTTT